MKTQPQPPSLNWYACRGKRLCDVILVASILPVVVPVLLVLVLLVRLKLGSPVFFRQSRPGKDGQPFTLLKFRTMTDGRDADGTARVSGASMFPSDGAIFERR